MKIFDGIDDDDEISGFDNDGEKDFYV